MKSVRLGHELETRLEQAARQEGRTESDLIREAIAEKVDKVLGGDALVQLSDFIGAIDSGGMNLAREAHRNAGAIIANESEHGRTRPSRR